MNSESIHHSLQGRLTAQWRVRRRRRRGSTELLWLMRSEGDDIAVPFLPPCLAVLLLSHQHFNPSHALSLTRRNAHLCACARAATCQHLSGRKVLWMIRWRGLSDCRDSSLLFCLKRPLGRVELMGTFVALNWGLCLLSPHHSSYKDF